jgi:arylsulfatase A-like enzyme
VFDGLAERGVLFTRAVAQAPSTLPSHGALMTGLYPSAYGRAHPFPVPPHVDTLAEILRRHRFTTWGFTDGGYLRRDFGLHQGFTHYEDVRVGLGQLTRRIDRMLARRGHGRMFLFVHTYDVHTPYKAPEQDRLAVGAKTWRGRTSIGASGLDELELERPPLQPEAVEPLVKLYDAGVRYADRQAGRAARGARPPRRAGRAVVVVLSDHGEEFFEHGRTQHKQLFMMPNLHVPLLWLVPGRPPARIGVPIELIDVLPTALSLLDLPPDAQAMGRSLVPLMDGPNQRRVAGAYSEGLVWTAKFRSLVTDRYQLIYNTVTRRSQLYDYTTDPRAQRNLVWRKPDVAKQLTAEVKRREALAAERRVDGRPRLPASTPRRCASCARSDTSIDQPRRTR